jgi:hypothetical protein
LELLDIESEACGTSWVLVYHGGHLESSCSPKVRFNRALGGHLESSCSPKVRFNRVRGRILRHLKAQRYALICLLGAS